MTFTLGDLCGLGVPLLRVRSASSTAHPSTFKASIGSIRLARRAGAGRLVFTDRGVLPRRFAPLAGLDGPHAFAARRRAFAPRQKLR